ncbi:D-lactate dehydrogenase [Chitinophaga polysaccharea]|uniref:D-lactate dehydrogenase n=1 Tax=Chitinophaga polysaccharea TaxID=1293035 RepID=A0A561Q5R3_9BACT|nr:2-hydroxyacid dehydrogenase [Chitinophaga polysaccharea]TWF45705.1 D-lactate dehydrogenase [Chitinophaga polysaccharea]
MKILIYSLRDFEQPYFDDTCAKHYSLLTTSKRLTETTVALSEGCDGICIFTSDDARAPVLQKLSLQGIRYIAIRAAGYDNVDLQAAAQLGIRVANVPAYSPYAIAEHAVSMMLALNRKIRLSNSQVHQYDFTIRNLVGFDMHQKTVGIIGTGKTGAVVATILHGFGCQLLGYDIERNNSLASNLGLRYTDLETLYSYSDIITLHTGLNSGTKYMIDKKAIMSMKKGVMLINTSRGAIINTKDVIDALETGHIGYLGIDVYENEKGIFFEDLRNKKPADKILDKLLNMPNVLVTPHQGFATHEALQNIATTTCNNFHDWEMNETCPNELNNIALI